MKAATVLSVVEEDEPSGSDVEARRLALDEMEIGELATLAKVNRDTLRNWELGKSKPQRATRDAVLRTLERLEAERAAGTFDPPPAPPTPRTVTYRLQGNFGIDVTVEGPIDDMAELQASVVAILAQMQQQATRPTE